MTTFSMFNLPENLQRAIDKLGFKEPTPIQKASIPLALSGKDILGSAQTGTGKTGAFIIPAITHLLNNKSDTVLVITPTREIATQVSNFVRQILNTKGSIKTVLLIGGNSKSLQAQELKNNHPRLMIGTPGRINDFLRDQSLLKNTKFVVLDEIDRMLDMGFSVQIDEIVKHLPEKRQTLMFSATLPDEIVKLSKKYLNNPERIAIGSTTTPIANIETKNIDCEIANKFETFVEVIKEYNGQLIAFVKTKHNADKIAKKLKDIEIKAQSLHGDLRQTKREKVIKEFREGKFKVLVGTDVAARGIDIPNIECVINHDLPGQPEDYIHRIGRTARAGAKGNAVNLITTLDKKNWKEIQKLINPEEFKQEDDSELKEKSPKKSRRSRNRGSKKSFTKKTETSFKKEFSGKKQDEHKSESHKKSFSRKNKFRNKKKLFSKDSRKQNKPQKNYQSLRIKKTG